MVHPAGGGAESSGGLLHRESGELRAQPTGALGGVVGSGDRPHNHDAFGSRIDDLADGVLVDATDGEPGTGRAVLGRLPCDVADEVGADAGSSGLGRSRPDRADAEIVQLVRAEGGVDLPGVMGGETDGGRGSDDGASDRRREVLLPEVENGCAGDAGDIGSVIDRPELPVPGSNVGEDAEDVEFLSALQRLVPQLDDVHTAGVGGIDEAGEVALAGAGIGAEVQLGGSEGHEVSVTGVRPLSDRMRSDGSAVDVAVIGGGIIGLSIAWRAVQRGCSVRLIDPAPTQGATFAAAGMLAPVSEYHYQEHDLLALMLASAARYPDFVQELTPDHSTVEESTGYLRTETLLVGIDHGDRQALADLHTAHRRWKLAAEPLTTLEARSREPLLGPRVTSAYRIAGDHQVDPRVLAARLLDALARADSAGIVRERAAGLSHSDPDDPASGVVGVHVEGGAVLTAREVVLANSLGANAIGGLPPQLTLPMRPVFGDILRMRVPGRLRPLLTTTVRALVHGESVYLVPRADGTLVVGATQREDGMDGVSAGGVHRLLRDAQEVLPAVAELELIETTARARPATPDNAPLLGRACGRDGADIPGLILATGFYRHGVLLAPAAADICLDLIDGHRDPRWDAFRPDRFSPQAVAAAGRTTR